MYKECSVCGEYAQCEGDVCYQCLEEGIETYGDETSEEGEEKEAEKAEAANPSGSSKPKT